MIRGRSTEAGGSPAPAESEAASNRAEAGPTTKSLPPPGSSAISYEPANGRQQGCTVVADPGLEHRLDPPERSGIAHRIAVDEDQVGALARFERADLALAAEVAGAVEGTDLDRLLEAEPRLDEQLDLADAGEA